MSHYKTISILGSTGSIGTQGLDIIRKRNQESKSGTEFQVIALSAGSKLDLLIEQIREFQPKYVSILAPESRQIIQELFPKIEVLDSIEELAKIPVDLVLSAIVGIAGLGANLEALKHSKRVAIANKETLVSAKHLVQEYQHKYKSELIPVDSEHAAIHQCLSKDNSSNNISKILLTSSGGPFRTLATEEFTNITKAQALQHPKWIMGPKITIDSSTLMNKGLEVIEANALFDVPYSKIEVVIHPQSIVHSAVSFIDGNTLAQLSLPDMRICIQYALDYPERKNIYLEQDFDIFSVSPLEFEKPDHTRFPALKLAYQAGLQGHSYPTVLNSANEAAVANFLEDKIHYTEIIPFIDSALNTHNIIKNPSLDEILDLDQRIKTLAKISPAPALSRSSAN